MLLLCAVLGLFYPTWWTTTTTGIPTDGVVTEVDVPNVNLLLSQSASVDNVTANGTPQMVMPSLPSSSNTTTLQIEPNDYIFQYSWGGSPIVVEKYNLVFFTVPKVACSTWKQLFRRMMGYAKWNQPNPHNPKTNGLRYLFHYSTSEATHWLTDPNVTRAIFVRDPKRKFLSAYLDKAMGKGGEHVRVKCCRSIKEEMPEDECVRLARSSLHGFLQVTANCSDTHWGLQSDRMGQSNKAKALWETINFVGHLETIGPDAHRLLMKLGVWEEFGQTGWGKYGNESLFESTTNVPHATLAKASSSNHAEATNTTQTHKDTDTSLSAKDPSDDDSWKQLSQYYTPEIEAAVEERYARDYDLSILGMVRRKVIYDDEMMVSNSSSPQT
eukprot:Nitzschia sp. Nitz4//scaffold218_size35881//20646//21797//NITZ4_007795-RA/size35881-processed-gene-0.19-mRNA-1//-1//CDS//3329542283//1711//frame0